jgi:hypothetical protein
LPVPLSLPLRLRQPAAAWHGVPGSSPRAPPSLPPPRHQTRDCSE